MANIVRLRVERKDGPDALKNMLNMLNAWRKNRGWIDKDYRRHQAYETTSQKKRRKQRANWIKRQAPVVPRTTQENQDAHYPPN